MAPAQRLIKQIDGLEVIRALLTTKPEDIVALHEEARKQMSLTEAQSIKLENDKSFMVNADRVAEDLKSRYAEFSKEKDEYAAKMAAENAEIVRQKNQYEELIASAKNQTATLNEGIKNHEESKKSFEKNKYSQDALIKSREIEILRREEKAAKWESALEVEAQRLSELRQSLDRKAKAVADAIGS